MPVDLNEAEPDQLAGAPHPREQTEFFGHAGAERSFLDAIEAGRLHHAWLIGGPQGVGKATLAYRVARYLLAGGNTAHRSQSLHVDPDHPAARRVAARSHPDLAVVRRGLRADGKGYSADIRVADVRRALDLFGSTPGEGGYRVCIVDAGDDLNASSANALLKIIEEPPPRSVFLIVAHAPQRLLPTVRSRCRRLLLRPLAEEDLRSVIRSLSLPWTDVEDAALGQAVGLAEGSVRRAVEMLDSDLLKVVSDTQSLLDGLPKLDPKRVLTLAESVAKRGAEDSFRLALDTVMRWTARDLEARAASGPARLAPLVEVCEKVTRTAREAEVYNLDKRPLVVSMFADLAEAVRRTA
jgi:DNA polymerase III subunit delta'